MLSCTHDGEEDERGEEEEEEGEGVGERKTQTQSNTTSKKKSPQQTPFPPRAQARCWRANKAQWIPSFVSDHWKKKNAGAGGHLAAEGAGVLGALRDLNLLGDLAETGAIASAVLADNADLLCVSRHFLRAMSAHARSKLESTLGTLSSPW